MGNVISLDMSIIMLRVTIFDKRGKLKTLLDTELNQETKEEKKENKEELKIGDTLGPDGFTSYLTFHSSVHNGSFYFLQFNILRTNEVLDL